MKSLNEIKKEIRNKFDQQYNINDLIGKNFQESKIVSAYPVEVGPLVVAVSCADDPAKIHYISYAKAENLIKGLFTEPTPANLTKEG